MQIAGAESARTPSHHESARPPHELGRAQKAKVVAAGPLQFSGAAPSPLSLPAADLLPATAHCSGDQPLHLHRASNHLTRHQLHACLYVLCCCPVWTTLRTSIRTMMHVYLPCVSCHSSVHSCCRRPLLWALLLRRGTSRLVTMSLARRSLAC